MQGAELKHENGAFGVRAEGAWKIAALTEKFAKEELFDS
jgi:hypothetical protein